MWELLFFCVLHAVPQETLLKTAAWIMLLDYAVHQYALRFSPTQLLRLQELSHATTPF